MLPARPPGPAPRPAPSRPAPPPVIPPPAAAGVRVGPWRLDEALGPGTFAATEVASGDRVVVKVAEPTPAALARARGEQAALEALGGGGHPALVAAAGVHEVDGRHALATRLVPGAPLDQLVAAHGPLPFPVAAGLLAPVAEALAAIHRRGWVHGDVSPANVVVDGHGAVLVDLGSARPIGPATADVPREATPSTAAPEVLAGDPHSTAADVWALAAVVVVAATGEPPTTGSPLAASMALVLRRALATDPSQRPSAEQLAASLRAVAEPVGDPPMAAPAPVPRDRRTTVDLGTGQPPGVPVERRLPAWPLVLLAAAVALAAVLLGWPAR
jgi:serine/threonine protein kinase